VKAEYAKKNGNLLQAFLANKTSNSNPCNTKPKVLRSAMKDFICIFQTSSILLADHGEQALFERFTGWLPCYRSYFGSPGHGPVGPQSGGGIGLSFWLAKLRLEPEINITTVNTITCRKCFFTEILLLWFRFKEA
jgi:hypothetical protein